jgi:hypothetical protein
VLTIGKRRQKRKKKGEEKAIQEKETDSKG